MHLVMPHTKKILATISLLVSRSFFESTTHSIFFLNYCPNFGKNHRSGRPTKITPNILRIVEAKMQIDDETTAVQIQKKWNTKLNVADSVWGGLSMVRDTDS